MNPIIGLLKKDFHISRSLFLIWAGAVMLSMAAGFGLSAYLAQPAGSLPASVLIGLSHFVFAPVFMLALLNMEAKTQLWLYIPRRGIQLISTKFAVIFSYQLILQLLLTLYTAFNLFWFGRQVYQQIGMSQFLEAALILNIVLLVFGFYFTSWLTFLWTVYHSLKSLAKFVRWIIVLAIIFSYNTIESLLLNIDPLRELIFKYNVSVISEASLQYENETWSALLETADIPVLPIFYYAVLIVVLIALAARLLERKVEV
jgi:hypothetical protein